MRADLFDGTDSDRASTASFWPIHIGPGGRSSSRSADTAAWIGAPAGGAQARDDHVYVIITPEDRHAQVSSGGNACPGPPQGRPRAARSPRLLGDRRRSAAPAGPSGYPAGMARARVGFGGALVRLAFLVVLSAVSGALV